jgi:hypothetical protein
MAPRRRRAAGACAQARGRAARGRRSSWGRNGSPRRRCGCRPCTRARSRHAPTRLRRRRRGCARGRDRDRSAAPCTRASRRRADGPQTAGPAVPAPAAPGQRNRPPVRQRRRRPGANSAAGSWQRRRCRPTAAAPRSSRRGRALDGRARPCPGGAGSAGSATPALFGRPRRFVAVFDEQHSDLLHGRCPGRGHRHQCRRQVPPPPWIVGTNLDPTGDRSQGVGPEGATKGVEILGEPSPFDDL